MKIKCHFKDCKEKGVEIVYDFDGRKGRFVLCKKHYFKEISAIQNGKKTRSENI